MYVTLVSLLCMVALILIQDRKIRHHAHTLKVHQDLIKEVLKTLPDSDVPHIFAKLETRYAAEEA